MPDSLLADSISFREILESGTLPDSLRAQIQVALADATDPELGRASFERAVDCGVDPREIARNRRGESSQPRIGAALCFARAVARTAGDIDEALLAVPRRAGWRDDEIAEIVALVAIEMLDACLGRGTRPEAS